jgi:hypothetical protein
MQLMLASTSNFNTDSHITKQMIGYVQNLDANIYEDDFDPPVEGPLLEGQEREPSPLDVKIKECLESFYELMNIKAQSQGMRQSHFCVAHGMHHENNYSTALDIAKMSVHMMKNT